MTFAKPKGRQYDRAYLAAVHKLPCLARELDPTHICRGWGNQLIDAAHLGDRSQNRKADDRTAVALCHHAHMQLHALKGPWKGWTKEQLRQWKERAIRKTQKRVAMMQP